MGMDASHILAPRPRVSPGPEVNLGFTPEFRTRNANVGIPVKVEKISVKDAKVLEILVLILDYNPSAVPVRSWPFLHQL